jgi:hypothetical protein
MSANKGLLRLNKLHRTRENSIRKIIKSLLEEFIKHFFVGLTDVVRVLDENIPKYRQVNYDTMREIINERKICGTLALKRGISN